MDLQLKTRCLDRTGTGIAVLVLARGESVTVEAPGLGSTTGSVVMDGRRVVAK